MERNIMNIKELFEKFMKRTQEHGIQIVKYHSERDLNDDVLKIYLERSNMTIYENTRCVVDYPIVLSLTKRLNINDIHNPIYSLYFNVQGNTKDHNGNYKHITLYNFYETTLKYSLNDIVEHFFEYFKSIKPALYPNKK
jgi:hypothetical protein